MDEGAPGLDRLGGEIAGVRDDLDTLLSELDRRRHEALDVPLQLRRHALGVALTALAVGGIVAGGVWLAVGRRRRRERPLAQAGRLRDALARMTAHPERVAVEPTLTSRLVAAVASAAVATLARKLLERAADQVMDARADRPRPEPVRVAEPVRPIRIQRP